ncbi:acyl-CoA dehydrogenase family protein [Actinomadura napierensis]|uniref:Acyl-CoA dehydrogenase family protein n=1 Tax=Actinomadura napierensis TaxID=267854 RepID=A0ABN3A4T0_9ACTN
MTLVRTPEQRELQQVVRDFLAAHAPEEHVRRWMETGTGHDPRLWSLMAGQLGLQALAIPEEYGGAGFGHAELAVAMEELGRAVTCGPFLSSAVLAAQAVLHCGTGQAKKDLLPGIADGTTIATLALDGPFDAVETDGGWTVTGTAGFVTDGALADVVLVTGTGDRLFAVTAAERTPVETMDGTRKMARVRCDGTPATLAGRAGPVLGRALDAAAILLAAEQLGVAQRALDMAVSYARDRVQFGRPIGSFQAIKHRCAEMLVEVEAARSCVAAAVRALDGDAPPGETASMAALARTWACEAAARTTAENIRIHGGIGFTFEHPAHLYYRRAKADHVLLGTPDRARA